MRCSVKLIIHELAKADEKVTARRVSEKCQGALEGKGVPEGTVKNSEAWKKRETTIQEAGGARDQYERLEYWSSDAHDIVDGSGKEPVDELIDRESQEDA